MSHEDVPSVVHCGFCEQGILRLMRCSECDAEVAVCDECELLWSDLAAVGADPETPSAGTYPTCPLCQQTHHNWTPVSDAE